MKLHLVAFLALLLSDTFAAQVGDKREFVEKEYGEPYVTGTREIAGRSVVIAQYADKHASVFYVKDTCVAIRLSGGGEIGPDDVLSLLRPFSIDGRPWDLSSLDSESHVGKSSHRKD